MSINPKQVLIQEKGIGKLGPVPRSLFLALLSWGFGSLASLVVGEVASVPLMPSRARQGAHELGVNLWVSFPLVGPKPLV